MSMSMLLNNCYWYQASQTKQEYDGGKGQGDRLVSWNTEDRGLVDSPLRSHGQPSEFSLRETDTFNITLLDITGRLMSIITL